VSEEVQAPAGREKIADGQQNERLDNMALNPSAQK